MIKIDVISGFLGAGKTTLIKKLFESKAYKQDKVVLIENEFGEIGIDGTFLKDSGIEIKEINSGCICCSLVGDFSTSMIELIEKFNPDRIIIEPSGVGKLSDIINAVKKVDADLKLNILVTVVDAGKAKLYLKNFGEFFNNQVEAADTIVVGKVDKVSEDKLVESVDVIKSVNSKANVITTTISSLDGDKLLAFLEEKASLREEFIKETEYEHNHEDGECDDPNCSCHHHHDKDEEHEHHCHHHHEEDEEHEHHCHHHHDEDEEHEHHCCHHHEEDEEHEHHCHHHHEEGEGHHHHHHHDADEVFTSWGMETPRSFTKEELKSFLDVLCDEKANLGFILRSKGILKASDNNKWYYFDLVAGDYEIRLGEPDYTGRVVVIGSKIDEDKISALFNKKA